MTTKSFVDPTKSIDPETGGQTSLLSFDRGVCVFAQTGEPVTVKGGKVYNADTGALVWEPRK